MPPLRSLQVLCREKNELNNKSIVRSKQHMSYQQTMNTLFYTEMFSPGKLQVHLSMEMKRLQCYHAIV